MDGHEYGEEAYYGDETNHEQDQSDQYIPPPLRASDSKKIAVEAADSDEDEEEARDNVADADDPLVITVQFEIKILCAKEILLRDGTHLKVQCTRGEQKTQTNTKLLKSNTVYFQ